MFLILNEGTKLLHGLLMPLSCESVAALPACHHTDCYRATCHYQSDNYIQHLPTQRRQTAAPSHRVVKAATLTKLTVQSSLRASSDWDHSGIIDVPQDNIGV